MDNVTHTLIGVLVGESIARVLPNSSGGLPADTRRNLLVILMAAGGNFPDLDFLYSSITGDKLGYLLHHRGHTHTVIGALAAAALLLITTQAWLRWRRLRPTPRDHLTLAAVALLAPLVHIAMDFSNNYGVHPFWPFHNGWWYGDSVFIIEPLLWAACAPLAFVLRTRAARGLVMAVLAVGVALVFFSGLVPRIFAVAFTTVVGLMLVIGRRATPRIALASGLVLWIGVTAMFAATSHIAGDRVESAAARRFSQASLYDHVLTPMPVNPVCWEVLLIQGAGDDVALRRAMLSLAPSWMPADECPNRSLRAAVTAPIRPVNAIDDAELQWYGEVVSSRSRLAEAAAADCRASAFMQFARAPWLATIEDALVIGDLRYDREVPLGFAEVELSETPGRCPAHVPPWTAPRIDLLRQ
ncbi:MAG: metal-dependent hydrolase [Steroidobacter sp.]